MEQKVLACIVRSRENWEQALPHFDEAGKDFSPEALYLLTKIREFYTTDPNAQSVDVDILCQSVLRDVPSVKRAERINAVIQGLPQDVSSVNVLKELVSVKRHSLGLKLAGLLSVGKADSEEAVNLMTEFLELKETGEAKEQVEALEGVKVTDLIGKHFTKENCIELWPKQLNDAVDGQAKPGHHILVFAPTEMGKTLIVINLAAGFVSQGKRVLYIGNEDQEGDLYMRYMTRMTRMNVYEIKENPAKAQALLDKRNYGLLVLQPLAPGTFYEIRKLCDKYKPDVVILDQLRNLDVRSEGRTQQLEKAATEARNLAKSRRVLVVSVTQAGDSASGKRVLSRGDVDSSNVGIPGQVDLMIGIGANEADEAAGFRTFSFPKNKLSGKHGSFQVQVDPLTSRVIEE
jgi:archaellum biogenesis ATPase FlaH